MKKYLYLTAAMVFIAIAGHAELITVHNDNIYVGVGGIQIEQFPDKGWDYTGYAFDLLGDQVYTHGTYLDEGCSVSYRSYDGAVSYGLAPYGGVTYTIGYGLFYFDVGTTGGWDEQQQRPTSIVSGWALMDNSPSSGLNMIQSQLTYDVVPEPSTLAMMGLASVFATAVRRRILV
jgi:hypothetical protein